jgi:HEAT repeat protein
MTYDDDFKLDTTDPLDLLDEQAAPPLPDPEEMLPLLDSADHQQRMLAARAFCELQDSRAILKLVALLKDSCPMIRVSAAYALARNPSPEVVEPLIQQLEQDWNGYVRKGVVHALGNCGDRRSLNPLVEALTYDIAAVRLWAASALGQLFAIDYETLITAVPPLIKALQQDPVDVVRSNCAWALGQICRELPLDAIYSGIINALLEAMVNEEDLSVRDDAKEALLKVGDTYALQRIEELEQEGFFW